VLGLIASPAAVACEREHRRAVDAAELRQRALGRVRVRARFEDEAPACGGERRHGPALVGPAAGRFQSTRSGVPGGLVTARHAPRNGTATEPRGSCEYPPCAAMPNPRTKRFSPAWLSSCCWRWGTPALRRQGPRSEASNGAGGRSSYSES